MPQRPFAGGRGRAGEIQRTAQLLIRVPGDHRLDHGGIGLFGFVADRGGQGADVGAGFFQGPDGGPELFGVQRRQVALQIDHHVMGAFGVEPCPALPRSGPNRTAVRGRSEPPARPLFSPPPTISGSPAATTTGPSPAATARAQTRTIMGTPEISASGLLGSRVEAMRAGISRMGFMTVPWTSLFRLAFALRPATACVLCDASPQ